MVWCWDAQMHAGGHLRWTRLFVQCKRRMTMMMIVFLVVENSKKKTLLDDKCKFPKEAKLLVELVVSYLLISTFHLWWVMTLLVMLMVFVYDYEIMHIVDCTTISMEWWMVIWFGRVVFQMINKTLITLDVNMVWTLWDQCVIQSITKHCLSPRNLAVTLESGEVFSVYEQLFDLAAIWQEVTSSPSPQSQSGVHKDHCCNLTDLKTWHYLICFLFHFFLFLLIFQPLWICTLSRMFQCQ